MLGARASGRGYFDRDALRTAGGRPPFRPGVTRAMRLWLLVNLEIWQRIFIDGEAPGDVMHAVDGRRVNAVPHATDLTQCAFSG